ncbi:MAG TPA: tetratricopeptide repeat protein, partial [Leptospiraceae bacterium]|nr:tetratricopeptide repeat protein [Leptospiraceae bacterium]
MKEKKYLKEIEKGNFALALTMIDKELIERPEDPELLYNFAICCSRTGNHKKCITILKTLLDKVGKFIERDNVFRLIIFSLIQLQEYKEALDLTDERLRVNIGDLKLLSFRAHIMEKLNRLDEAIQIHRNILKLNPEYTNSLNSAGYLIATKKNPTAEEIAEATDYLKQAVKQNPNNAAYLDSFGVLLHKRGDKQAAIKAFNKAIAANPALS